MTKKYKPLPDNEDFVFTGLTGRVLSQSLAENRTRLTVVDGSNTIRVLLPINITAPQNGDIIRVTGKRRSMLGLPIVEGEDLLILTKTLRTEWFSSDISHQTLPREMQLLINEPARQAILIRSQVTNIVRLFLKRRQYLEVETPILLPERDIAPVSHFKTKSMASGREYFLRICPENYLKRLIVAGFSRVFEIGKNFRDESITSKNSPEFTVMECYEAYSNYLRMAELTEELIAEIVLTINGSPIISMSGRNIDITPPWTRISFNEAAREFAGIKLEELSNPEDLRGALLRIGITSPHATSRRELINLLAEQAIEPRLMNPTFLMDHPSETICVAKRHDQNPQLIERFEGFIGGVEFAHGYSEFSDAREQRVRMQVVLDEKVQAGDEKHELDAGFLTALEIGLPPTGGLGIGIDRIVMLLTNLPIEETVTFIA